MPRKGKHEEWLSEDALSKVEGWARDGFSRKQIAKKIHVAYSTFNDWMKKYPLFSEAIKRGEAPVQNDDEIAIHKIAQGYTVTETTFEVTVRKDKKGNVIGSSESTKTIEKQVAPNVTALIFLLKCLQGDKYNDKKSADDW